jgi:thiamine-monophosphate kinase
MDISDGLVQDLGHICRASGLTAEIDAALVPLSGPARAAGPEWLSTCLTGGDDYELLLAIPPGREAGIPVTRIGTFRAGPPEAIVRGLDGKPMNFARGGWSHF